MRQVLGIFKRLLGLAVVVGLGYGAWVGYRGLEADPEAQSIGEVPTEAATVRDITVSVSATGTLRPVRIVEVKSKAAGEILRMPVDLGDRVHAGDLIAQIDTETLEQQLAQSKADLESARVRLQVAEKQYQRAQELARQDLVSKQDLDNSQQNFTTARGQLLRAEAELKLAQERLDDATVRAPMDGTVIKKNVEEGTIIQSSVNSVQGGTTLVEMADLSTLEVRTLVDEIDIGRVRPGLPVETTVEAYPERKFAGEVIKIEPQAVIEQQVTTFPVLSYIDNHEGLLLPGMNADVEIIIHRRPGVLAVPNESVKTPADAARVADLLGLPFDRDQLTVLPGRPGAGAPAGAGSREVAAAEPAAGGPAASAAPAAAQAAGQERTARGPVAAGAEQPDGEGAAGKVGEQTESGKDDGEIDLSRLRSMSPQERREFFQNMSEEQRRKLRERFASRAGAGGAAGFSGGRFGGGAAAGGRGAGGFGGAGAGGGTRGAGGFAGDAGAADVGDRPGVSMDAFGIGRAPKPAVVFVLDENGTMQPRQVLVGVQDWEHTEIVSGLRQGERVVLLPSTSLLMSQQELRERFSRFSRLPGTGSSGRGRR